MAKYSIELREMISTFGEDEVKGWFGQWELSDFLDNDEVAVIENRGVWKKEKLLDRIITHFYTREIGTTAPAQFIMFVKDKMNEIMETYAPLIYSASIKYDPLVNVDFEEQFHSSNTGKSNSRTDSNGSALTVNSDTPQGEINKNEILNGKYASSTGANETDNTVTDNTNTTGTQDYIKTTKGNSGVSATAQKMVLQYRENIRALNSEIINDLEVLFMGIY